MDKPQMFTVNEVAETYRKHPVTVRIALQDGALHGRQSVKGGRWLVQDECADAWSQGSKCPHMISARKPISLDRLSA